MLNKSLIAEIQHEGLQTKKILERVPFDQFDWKPHDKSMHLGRLAVHIAEIPRWTSRALATTEFDIATMQYKPSEVHSTNDIVALSEKMIQTALHDLEKASDEDLKDMWTLRRGEQVIFSLPRIAVIRSMSMNHLIHHRGQLSVYLRLLNVSIPGMYGPSADEMI